MTRRTQLSSVLGFLIFTILIHIVLLLKWNSRKKEVIIQNKTFKYSEYTPDNQTKKILKKTKAKAAIVILTRNEEIDELKKTIPMFERRFNEKYNYPYVFLNDIDFISEFKDEMRRLSNSEMMFGTIPKEHWGYPPWVDPQKAYLARKDMENRKIIYGGSESYRHMCRFNSGFFYRHPLLANFEYYWRVEPGVEFYCDMVYDPFDFMKSSGKDYGFVIMLPEFKETIPSLWSTVKKFIHEKYDLLPSNNSIKMIIDDVGNYNLCHFWSNFEIGSLNFFRSKEYGEYFEYLDKSGGFFYERWGDAPVHTIGAALLLPPEKIHFFEDIGYKHTPYSNCPSNPALQSKCDCKPKDSINLGNKCLDRYIDLFRK